jgi:membrane-associated phospholipid phosphatase
MFIGMTVCLIIYTIWPNGHHLRVDLHSLGRSNIFTYFLSYIYTVDTATNVFPSIHVFNSIASYLAISKSDRLKKYKWIQNSALILTILICMSTVLLKQHSVLDIFGAVALNIAMYFIVYVPDWSKIYAARRARREQRLSNI